jgi:hypothetical protein
VDFDAAVVIDQSQFSKFIHEETHAGSGRSDHLRKRLLADFCYDRLRPTFLAKIRQQQKSPRQAFLSRIEQLIDQVLLDTTVARWTSSVASTVTPAVMQANSCAR